MSSAIVHYQVLVGETVLGKLQACVLKPSPVMQVYISSYQQQNMKIPDTDLVLSGYGSGPQMAIIAGYIGLMCMA